MERGEAMRAFGEACSHYKGKMYICGNNVCFIDPRVDEVRMPWYVALYLAKDPDGYFKGEWLVIADYPSLEHHFGRPLNTPEEVRSETIAYLEEGGFRRTERVTIADPGCEGEQGTLF